MRTFHEVAGYCIRDNESLLLSSTYKPVVEMANELGFKIEMHEDLRGGNHAFAVIKEESFPEVGMTFWYSKLEEVTAFLDGFVEETRKFNLQLELEKIERQLGENWPEGTHKDQEVYVVWAEEVHLKKLVSYSYRNYSDKKVIVYNILMPRWDGNGEHEEEFYEIYHNKLDAQKALMKILEIAMKHHQNLRDSGLNSMVSCQKKIDNLKEEMGI